MMHHDSRPPLRLLLVKDGSTIPTWLFKCVDSIERSGAATCVTVLRATPEDARSTFRFGHGLRRFCSGCTRMSIVGCFAVSQTLMRQSTCKPHSPIVVCSTELICFKKNSSTWCWIRFAYCPMDGWPKHLGTGCGA